jgi:hypothetical protein
MLAYQLSSFLLYVYLYAKLLHMPATNSISLYVYRLVQSIIWACYMPVLYANSSMLNSMSLHVSTSISATVLDSVCQLTYQVQYLLVCQMLYPICYVIICRLSYAKARMPVYMLSTIC